MNVKKLNPEKLQKYRTKAQRMLEKNDIYESIEAIDHSNVFRLSEKEIKCCKAIEDTIAVSMAVCDALDEEKIIKTPSNANQLKKSEMFKNTYALFIGCNRGLEILNNFNGDKYDGKFNFPIGEDINSAIKDVIKHYKGGVVSEPTGKTISKSEEDLFENTKLFVQCLKNTCLSSKDSYPEYLDEVENFSIEVNDIIVKGFDEPYSESALTFGGRSFDDIIGNEEFIDFAKRNVDMLFLYDPETRKNPAENVIDVPKTTLITGPPGTGKSLGLEAAVTYAQKKAQRLGKKFNVSFINHKIKNKYVGEGSKILELEFNKATDPNGIGMIIAEDLESLLPKREELENYPTEKELFNVMANLIEGIGVPKTKNYMIFCTTNHPDLLDGAIYARLKEKSIRITGPKNSQEIMDITKLHLKRGIESGYVDVKDDEWKKISDYAFEHEVVGRDIKNITKSIQDRAYSNMDIKDDIYSLSPREQERYIKNSIRNIYSDEIFNEFKKYVEQRDEDFENEEKRKYEAIRKDMEIRQKAKESLEA